MPGENKKAWVIIPAVTIVIIGLAVVAAWLFYKPQVQQELTGQDLNNLRLNTSFILENNTLSLGKNYTNTQGQTFSSSYSPTTKQVTIKLNDNKLTEVKLLTPLDVKVFYGNDRKVAEFEVTNYYNNVPFIQNLEFQNLKANNAQLQKDYVIKERTINYYRQVPIYDYDCTTPGKINFSQGNKEVCVQTLSHYNQEPVYNWTLINGNLSVGKHYLGLFTNVQRQESVEWIPELLGYQITEWASWNETLNEGIVAYWKLDDEIPADNGYDSVLGYHNLSWTGAGAQKDATAKIGTALYTDGVDYGDTVSTGVEFTSNDLFTIAGWVQFTQLNIYEYLFGGYDSSPNQGVQVMMGGSDAGDPIYVQIRGSATCTVGTSNLAKLEINKYYHVAIIYNGTSIHHYVNGTKLLEADCVNDIGDYTQSYFFMNSDKDGAPKTPLKGYSDEWGYWNISLTDDQITQLYNDGTGLTLPVSDTTDPTITDFKIFTLNSSRSVIGNETSLTTINLTEIEYLMTNFTVRDETGISDLLILRLTAGGKNSCSLGNNQSTQCYNITNANPNKWVVFNNGTNTKTFKDEGVTGDFISCTYDGTATERNYTCLIDEHYNPNVFKWYNASYDFSDVKWQNETDKRITQNNYLRIRLSDNIPLDADQYKLDFRVKVSTLTPTQPLQAFACNSTYSSGEPTDTNACELITDKLKSELQDDGTKFRGIFTQQLINNLNDLKWIVLKSNNGNPNHYYYIKTYNATNTKHPIKWEYSTNAGTDWTVNPDGYETELNINWFYDSTHPTQVNFMVEVNDTSGNNANSSVYDYNWTINATNNYPPIINLLHPNANELIDGNYSINWTAKDPNDHSLLTNLTLTNDSGVIVIATSVYDIIRNWTINSDLYQVGSYNLTLVAWENSTTDAFYDEVIERIFFYNVPKISGELEILGGFPVNRVINLE